MAGNNIVTGDNIVYSTLITEVVNFLKTICYNVDGFKSDVPAELKNGTSYTLATRTFSETRTSDGGKDATHNIARTAHTSKVTAKVNDLVAVTVTSAEITNQLNSFLNSRGINVGSKEGVEIVSLKSIMNFYANVSSFISSRLVYVSNSFGKGPFLFYNKNDVSYENVTFGHDKNFSNSDIRTCMEQIMNTVMNTSKAHNVVTTISYACSSCSSSSSSSCSSSSSSSCSSSSSSSSFFIAFMDI